MDPDSVELYRCRYCRGSGIYVHGVTVEPYAIEMRCPVCHGDGRDREGRAEMVRFFYAIFRRLHHPTPTPPAEEA